MGANFASCIVFGRRPASTIERFQSIKFSPVSRRASLWPRKASNWRTTRDHSYLVLATGRRSAAQPSTSCLNATGGRDTAGDCAAETTGEKKVAEAGLPFA